MFNHSKKNRKNRKNVTKNNIKKIKKKYDTRKVKVKNVKKTRKNLVGGKPPAFITLLEDSFKQYKSISKNQTPLLEKIPDKKDNSLSFILIKGTDLRSYHIHYGKNFMGFPSGNGGRTNQGEKLIEDNNPTLKDVINAIKTWETLVNNDQANNTEWQKLFDIMKTKVTSERHKYIFSTNLRNDETPDDDDVDDNDDSDISTPAERDATSILLSNNVKGIGLSRKNFPLCGSTIDRIKTHEYEKKVIKTIKSQINKIEAQKFIYTREEKQEKFNKTLLETHLKLELDKNKLKTMLKKDITTKDTIPNMKKELKDLIIAQEFDYMNILYKYLLYRIWCLSGNNVADKDTKWAFTTTEDEFLKRNIIEKAKTALDTVLKSDRPLYKDFTKTDTLVQLIAKDKLISLELKPIEYLAEYLERNKQYIANLIQK